MPELPEVESCRQTILEHGRGKKIEKVFYREDEIVFDGSTGRQVSRKVKGRTIDDVERWGKHLWINFDRGPALCFHLGMTGWFFAYPEEGDRHKFWKLELVLEDGTRIGFKNSRRLGRIRLRKDPMAEPPISKLGPDPYLSLPSPAEFRKLIEPRRGIIKSLLLNQSFLAGLGNWIADEVLYQAKINPHRGAHNLSAKEVNALRKAIDNVLKKAVAVDANAAKFPQSWLFHRRWGKDNDATDAKNRPLQFDTIGGRTTAWVPDVQR